VSRSSDRRFASVAIIGVPNAGKSTLVNRLVGAKVAIVTHKAQTTRSTLTGISMHGQTQLAFIDTPGIFRGKKSLDQAMVSAAWRSLGRADIVALLVPAAGRGRSQSDRLLADLKKRRSDQRKHALVINKVDRVKKHDLLEIADQYASEFEFDAVFMISALNGSGVDDLHDWLDGQAPKGRWMYDSDQLVDVSSQFAACEITREKLMLRLHQELPYHLTVEPEEWKPARNGSTTIRQVIYVERAAHKKIVVGAGGSTIKQVGMAARQDIAELIGTPVNLMLRVKHRDNWMEDSARYTAMGLEYPRG